MMTEVEEATAASIQRRKEFKEKTGYSDPLHVPSDLLVVKYGGKEIYMMNKRLLDRQNCWENLEDIKETHWLKLMFCEMIMETTDISEMKELAKDITECEFELQRLWKFTEDAKFHRFWEIPKCQCPKLDNDDAYPTGYYVTSSACPLHWERDSNENLST